MTVEFRPERPGDEAAIAAVTLAAFGNEGEARLIETLRTAGALEISQVAEDRGHMVGHIAFSPVTVEINSFGKRVLGLGPMAVEPECQGDGIGGRLVRAGLTAAREADWQAVVVLGHPGFYARFGFARTALRLPGYPADAFMAMALRTGGLAGLAGAVRYHAAFDALS